MYLRKYQMIKLQKYLGCRGGRGEAFLRMRTKSIKNSPLLVKGFLTRYVTVVNSAKPHLQNYH